MADMEELSEEDRGEGSRAGRKKRKNWPRLRSMRTTSMKSMKKRIKYMYENGSGQLIAVLLESKDITDFLNKAEYISTISEYDRDMLKKFQDIVAEVEAQEESLQEEYDEIGGRCRMT